MGAETEETPTLAMIANHFGEEHAHDPHELAIQIYRKGFIMESEGGHVYTVDAAEIDGELEEWISRMFGGGTYELRLTRRSRLQKSTTIRIAGEYRRKSDAIRRIEAIRQGRDPDELDEDDDEEERTGPQLHGPYANPFAGPAFGPDWPPSIPKPKNESEAAELLRAAHGLFEQQGRGSGMRDLVPLLTALLQRGDETTKALVETMRREKSDPHITILQETWKQQTEAMHRSHELQMQMLKENSRTQQKMMQEGMASYLQLLTTIVKESRDKTPEGLIESLPGVLGQVMQPLKDLASRGPGAVGQPPSPGYPGAAASPGASALSAPGAQSPHPTKEGSSQVTSEGGSGSPHTQQGAGAGMQMQAAAVHQFLDLIVRGIQLQMDPYVFWDEYGERVYGHLPASVRRQVEQLDFDDENASTRLAEIFGSVEGADPSWLQSVVQVAASTEGGFDWLKSFWRSAPWVAEEEEDEEGDEEPQPAAAGGDSTSKSASDGGT